MLKMKEHFGEFAKPSGFVSMRHALDPRICDALGLTTRTRPTYCTVLETLRARQKERERERARDRESMREREREGARLRQSLIKREREREREIERDNMIAR